MNNLKEESMMLEKRFSAMIIIHITKIKKQTLAWNYLF